VNITRITVPVQAIHTVGPGDILRVVAKKYDVSLQALMKANGRTKNFAERGEKLVIPFSAKK
jgi:LysM repeat protein